MSDKLKINILKRLGDFSLELDQELELSGITALFGPSGAGKSTLLKLIAGFEPAEAGQIHLGEQTLFNATTKINISPHKRPIGYMFQDGRLFPHFTVKQNLEFAAKRASRPMGLDRVMSAFDIKPLLGHMPQTLSGGEARRVALARTVLTAPDLLLLDEPLTGLDRARKRDILPFIESLSREFSIPCLYVTHDIEEVTRLADYVMLISGGRVSGYGPIADILSHIDTTPLADDYDVSSLLTGRLITYDKALKMSEIDIAGTKFFVPLILRPNPGDEIRLRIRANDIAIALTPPKGVSIRNIIGATISQITEGENSPYTMVTLQLLGGDVLRAHITRAALQELSLETGQNVHALIKSVSFDGRL